MDEINISDDDYIVQKILACRRINGRLSYKVLWEGYNESDATWEPASNLNHLSGPLRKEMKVRESELIMTEKSAAEEKRTKKVRNKSTSTPSPTAARAAAAAAAGIAPQSKAKIAAPSAESTDSTALAVILEADDDGDCFLFDEQQQQQSSSVVEEITLQKAPAVTTTTGTTGESSPMRGKKRIDHVSPATDMLSHPTSKKAKTAAPKAAAPCLIQDQITNNMIDARELYTKLQTCQWKVIGSSVNPEEPYPCLEIQTDLEKDRRIVVSADELKRWNHEAWTSTELVLLAIVKSTAQKMNGTLKFRYPESFTAEDEHVDELWVEGRGRIQE